MLNEGFTYKSLYDLEIISGIQEKDITYSIENNVTKKIDKVIEISKLAFQDKNLTSVYFPTSTRFIRKDAFVGNKLTGELDLSNTNVMDIGIQAFMSNNISSVKFLSCITTIDYGAFYHNQIEGLLDLSKTNIITIMREAFSLNNIEIVKLPESIATIEEDVFMKSSRVNPNSNLNLIQIINPSGRNFNWSDITGSTTTEQTFPTGTIIHQNGNIEVTVN